jgi:hypothetical protein
MLNNDARQYRLLFCIAIGLILWRDRRCAVGVRDRQDSGIGRRITIVEG